MTNSHINKLTGVSYTYEYKILDSFDKNMLIKQRDSFKSQFSKIYQRQEGNIFTEWIVRHYLAGKMIMASTIMFNSLIYSKEHNIKMSISYFFYYILLNLSRGLIFVYPSQQWNEGKIKSLEHNKIISITHNILKSYDKIIAEKYFNLINSSKIKRERISYKFPANGFDDNDINDLKEISTLICDLIQFQSEISETTYKKYVCDFSPVSEILDEGCMYESTDGVLLDNEDAYRLSKIIRKQEGALGMLLLIAEGLFEDFFGSFHIDSIDEDNSFNPDKNTDVIFSFY
ncbi:MAG: hypothetical protein AB7V77_01650 [Candidatus Woesearchaeota archaeon]